jgi:integrase/recombinase XerD
MEKDIEAFLHYLAEQKGCSQNTLAAYRNDLGQLLAFIEEEKAKGIVRSTEGLIKGYLLNLREKGYSTATVARKVASAKSLFKFMVDFGRMRENPTQNLISPQVRKHPPKLVSSSEYQRLLEEPAKLSTPEARRDRVMLELLHATGLRVSELVSLNVQDVDFQHSCVCCCGRRIPLDPDVAQSVADYVKGTRFDLLYDEAEDTLFLNRRGKRLTRQGFWQIVTNYARKADLKARITPHSLRHSFAVHKLRTGADLQSVQQLLGHAYVSSTRIYRQA